MSDEEIVHSFNMFLEHINRENVTEENKNNMYQLCETIEKNSNLLKSNISSFTSADI